MNLTDRSWQPPAKDDKKGSKGKESSKGGASKGGKEGGGGKAKKKVNLESLVQTLVLKQAIVLMHGTLL